MNGKRIAEKVLLDVKKRAGNLKLAVILVGDSRPSKIFIKKKKEACLNAGIGFELFIFPSSIKEAYLAKEVKKICSNPENSGVVIQLPLPKHINTQKILNIVPPEKDADVLTGHNLGNFYCGDSSLLPPVVRAVSLFLKRVEGKNVVLIGSGRLVGLPLSLWLVQKGATVSVLNRKTKNISFFTKNADVVISGAGSPGIIKGSMVKKNSIVIDMGTSFKKGKLLGDVDIKSVSGKTKKIAPVPGGLGPATVACLLYNLTELK